MSTAMIERRMDEQVLRDRLVCALLQSGGDAPAELPVPASFEQQRMWYASRMEGAGSAYNLCNAIAIPTSVPTSLLRRCFDYMLERHGALRSRFAEHDGMPQLQVMQLEECGYRFQVIECDTETYVETVRSLLAAERMHVFDLAGECLVRISYLVNPAGGGTLVVNLHHIVTDAWSLAHFSEEFGEVITAFAQSREPHLPPLRARYGDYGLWQAAWMQSSEARLQTAFWRRQLQGVVPLQLPASSARPTQRSWEGASVKLDLGAGLLRSLDTLQRDCGTTRFAVLSAAVALSLHALGAASDITLGTSVSTRRESVLEPVFGLFLNQVVMRFDMTGNPDLRDFLSRAGRVAREAFSHSDLPFGQVVAAIGPERDVARSPLFDTLISLQNTPRSALQGATAPPVLPEQEVAEQDVAKFDLSFFFEEDAGHLTGQLVYSTRLFSSSVGRRLAECVVEVLALMPTGLDLAISKLKSQLRSVQAVEVNAREIRPAVSRIKRGERKAINLAELSGVDEAPMSGSMPYVYEASDAGVDVLAWLSANKSAIDARLLEYGAVLLRRMNLADIQTFGAVVQQRCRQVISGYGDLPEEKGTDRVYGSTPYPNDRRILFHSEGSHMARWPLHQFFACVIASPVGGETPIVDVRRIYDRLDPSLRERFHASGLSYVRNFIPGLDVPWQTFFKTRDPAEVERLCAASGADCVWKHDDILMVRQRSQAVAQHPVSGVWSFFNQIMLHHPYFLRPEEREALVSLHGEDNLPRQVTFGDGSLIDEQMLAQLVDLYESESVAFPWQAGDVLMLDNMSIAHARNPFSGPRKIIVGMGDPIESSR